jgi:hypothetical protein
VSPKPKESKATEGREGAVDPPERWSVGQNTEVVRGYRAERIRTRGAAPFGRPTIRLGSALLIKPPTCPADSRDSAYLRTARKAPN